MKMIDVGAKPRTERVAVARGFVAMAAATVARIRRGEVEKGDVLAAARLAGVMAAKKSARRRDLDAPGARLGRHLHAKSGGRSEDWRRAPARRAARR